MNKIAIRILIRVLDTLIEQTDEVKYAHTVRGDDPMAAELKSQARAFEMLKTTLNHLHKAKSTLADLVEVAD